VKSVAYNCDDLDGTQPKFELTKEFDTKIIDGDNHDQKDGDPDTGIDFLGGLPFLQNQCSRCELIWRGDDVFTPVSPTESKSKSRVAEAGSVAGKTRRVRDPCSHFTESCHDDVDKKTD